MSQHLPDGWVLAPLGDVAEVQLGKMLSAAARSGRGARPYLRNVNVRWHRINVDDVLEMDFDAREVEKFALRCGDVLVCEGGEPGRAAVWRDQLPDALYQKALHRVRFRGDSLDPEFFVYQLEFAAATGELGDRFTGSTIKHLPREVFIALPLRIAPRAEQRRIVAALEEHLSELDAAVAGLERARANALRFRDAVIFRLLLPSAGDIGVEDAVTAPSWPSVALRSLGELKGGITKGQKRRPGERTREVPYLRVANVQRGYLDLAEIKTIVATETEIEELALKSGDVLFNEGGDRDKLGRGWVWNDELPLCIHQNHVFRFRPDSQRIDSRFVSYFGNSHGQKYFLEQGKQTTNLASINLTKLGALPVPVPPVIVQKRIVSEIDRRLSATERLLRDLDVQLARGARLRESILKSAFEGNLVPQDPTDESAVALLDRIRAERSIPTTGPRTRAKAKSTRLTSRR